MLPHVSVLCHRRQPSVETCVDNTAELRPQASVVALRAAGASQLLKPASTTPRSYGRRNRSWHHGHAHATHNERRRGKRPVHHDQVHAWRRGYRPRHRDQVPATHNERRREQRPEHHGQVPCELNAGAGKSSSTGHLVRYTRNTMLGHLFIFQRRGSVSYTCFEIATKEPGCARIRGIQKLLRWGICKYPVSPPCFLPPMAMPR